MSKKKKTKSSGPAVTVPAAAPWPMSPADPEVTTILDHRLAALDNLRCAVKNLEGVLERLASKIEQGIDARWSQRSDALRYAQSIKNAELELALLTILQEHEDRLNR